jgi:hypothetical protein
MLLRTKHIRTSDYLDSDLEIAEGASALSISESLSEGAADVQRRLLTTPVRTGPSPSSSQSSKRRSKDPVVITLRH